MKVKQQKQSKQVYGNNNIDRFVPDRFICWGDHVNEVLRKGDLLIKETLAIDTKGFVRVLFSGPEKSGKTRLAALIAKKTQFPCIKICSPQLMFGYTESQTNDEIKNIFESASKSFLCCIFMDDIERLMYYSPLGPRYSTIILQSLLTLFGQAPLYGNRLLLIATTSNENFLRETGLYNCFSSFINIECLSKPEHYSTVLNVFTKLSQKEIDFICSTLKEKKLGIKRLLQIIDSTNQENRELQVNRFLEDFDKI